MRRTVLAITVLGVLTACGTPPPLGVAALPPPTGVTDARPPTGTEHDAVVAHWSDYAEHLTQPPLIVPIQSLRTQSGLSTGEPWQAAEAGRLEPAIELPTAPAVVEVQFPTGPVELPALSAAEALDALRATGDPIAHRNNAPPLRVTAARLTTTGELTDRGTLTIPTWRFTIEGAPGTVRWPAIAPPAIKTWNLDATLKARTDSGEGPEAIEPAQLSDDGRHLTVILRSPRIPCSAQPTYRHEARTTESGGVVVVGIERIPVHLDIPPNSPCDESPAWSGDPHVIRLTRPLGNRAVVDPHGHPLRVEGRT